VDIPYFIQSFIIEDIIVAAAIFLFSHLDHDVDLIRATKGVTNFIVQIYISMVFGKEIDKDGLNSKFCYYL